MKRGDAIIRRILKKLNRSLVLQESIAKEIVRDLVALSRHTTNRIAAHKAHLTMAKKAAGKLPVYKLKGV